MARLPRTSPYVPTAPSAQCRHPDAWRPLYPISPPLLSHRTRRRDGVRAGGAAGSSAPPRTTLSPQHSAAHGLPSRVPGAAFFSGSWPCSHIVSTSSWSLCCVPHAAHAGDTADGRLRLALLPAPSPPCFLNPQRKRKRATFPCKCTVLLWALSTCVCMCVHRCANAHEHTHADRSPVRRPPCLPGRYVAVLPRWGLQPCLLCAPPPHLPQ